MESEVKSKYMTAFDSSTALLGFGEGCSGNISLSKAATVIRFGENNNTAEKGRLRTRIAWKTERGG